MEEILKNLEDNINRLLNDVYRASSWDNEVRCSESIKNLCIAYSYLMKGYINGN